MPTPHQLHSRLATSPEEGDIHRIEEAVNDSRLHPLESSHPRRAAGVGEGDEEEEDDSDQSTSPQHDEGITDEGQLDGTDEHHCKHVHTQCQQGEERNSHLILHLLHCQTNTRMKSQIKYTLMFMISSHVMVYKVKEWHISAKSVSLSL